MNLARWCYIAVVGASLTGLGCTSTPHPEFRGRIEPVFSEYGHGDEPVSSVFPLFEQLPDGTGLMGFDVSPGGRPDRLCSVVLLTDAPPDRGLEQPGAAEVEAWLLDHLSYQEFIYPGSRESFWRGFARLSAERREMLPHATRLEGEIRFERVRSHDDYTIHVDLAGATPSDPPVYVAGVFLIRKEYHFVPLYLPALLFFGPAALITHQYP